MARICTSPYPSPYPIEKIGDSPYPYPVNSGIPRQNGDGFGQYPRGRVYLPSLVSWVKIRDANGAGRVRVVASLYPIRLILVFISAGIYKNNKK